MADERGLPGSAWEEWRGAGVAFAREQRAKGVSVVPLGEEAYRYSLARNPAHREVVSRAFVTGYYAEVQSWQ